MKIQHRQQLDELREALSKPGVRAENNAARIVQGIINTNDDELINEGLSIVSSHEDTPSKKKLNEAIVQIFLKPIKDKKGTFEDWAFFKVMCEEKNWSFFRWAGYSIDSFTDTELKKFINSKEMPKIEEFSATMLKYLTQSSGITALKNPNIYNHETLLLLGITPEHEIILGWEIRNHDEAKRILSISNTLLASYPHNEKIQKDNEEIRRHLNDWEEECKKNNENRAAEKLKWEAEQRRKEEEREAEQRRQHEEWLRKQAEQEEEQRRQEEEREAERKRLHEEWLRKQAEQEKERISIEEKKRQKELNIKILKILGWISLFLVPFIVLSSYMGIDGRFLYVVLLFLIGGIIVWWRVRRDWVITVQIVLIAAVIVVWITFTEYMNKPAIQYRQQTGLSCDWKTTERHVSIFSAPDAENVPRNVIARIPVSGTCVQEIGQTENDVKIAGKDENGEIIIGYVKKSELRKSN